MVPSRRASNAVALACFTLVAVAVTVTARAADKKPAAQTCSKAWSIEGQSTSKNYVYGLGLSAKKDSVEAADEAKQNAIKDIAQQLESNVSSASNLTETESGSTYSGKTQLTSDLKSLTGLHIIKEATDGGTKCAVAKFDAGAAYVELEGRMNVLEKSIADVSKAAKAKQYVIVLQKRAATKKLIADNADQITKADLFRTYLKSTDESWFEKIKGQETDIDKAAEDAKANIAFVLPSGPYEVTLSDIEGKLSGEGFEVVRGTGATKPVKITLELKETGTPRKTKTALGVTVISHVAVNLKDTAGRVIATNKGVPLTGTGPSDDDALANIDRQLLVHVLEVLNQGLPGLIAEN